MSPGARARGAHRPARSRGVRGVLLAVAALVLALLVAPAAHAAPGDLVLDGRGFGHGRGMAQWGAQGAGIRGLTHQQILGFYYPGTTLGTVPGASVRVLLRTRASSAVVESAVAVVDSATGLRAELPAGAVVTAARTTAGGVRVTGSTALTDPRWSDGVAGPVRLEGSGLTWLRNSDGTAVGYRGDLVVHAETTSGVAVVNSLDRELYLYSVVSKEMPAYFEPAALRSQAVAARSYSTFDCSGGDPRADLRPTTDCQVYGGRATRSAGGAVTSVEQSSVRSAVDATARVVVLRSGSPLRTEFSSSNGGRTAESVLGPAKDDPYDGVDPRNTNHEWTTTVPASRVEAAFPAIGTFTALEVRTRSGGGEWGGRAEEVAVHGTGGTVVTTGLDVRLRLGLRSTWFEPQVSGTPLSDVLLYRPDSGSRQVLDVLPGGDFRTLSTGGWSAGWDVTALEADGTPGAEALLYDPVTGSHAVVDARPDGLTPTLWTGTWSTGWDATAIEADGTPGSELLLYRASSGSRHVLDVLPGGGFRTLATGSWSAGWDVEAVESDGSVRSEVLVYNPDRGYRYLLDVLPGGGFRTLDGGPWSTGWDITPMEADGTAGSELLLYRSSSGSRQVLDVLPGGFRTLSSGTSWTTDWDITAFEADGSAGSELLLYRASSGSRQVLDVLPAGFRTLSSGSSWTTGWDVTALDAG
ncbi:SpoIID/LytB domain-containing protein [Aquipuribacter nitratireducens]|uniref:SpoIID/LytB domain-containing protein n=1 Tax=Aquipuribacter nitratireducens TaxID=650104 RepID=A0ABW0GK09_9MICO